MRPSLRRRLLWLVGLPVVVLWLAAGAWLAQRTAHETGEMFDRELQRTAASVLAIVTVLPDRASRLERPGVRRQQADQRPEIVVRDRSGRLLLDASTLPVLPAGGDDTQYRSVRHDGASWRVYQRWDATHRYWIQVAAPLHDREQLLMAHVGALLVPLAALVLLLPLAIWLGLRGGLAPLRRVSREIATQPAETPTLTRDDVPVELRQLTRALDQLVTHLDGALARERRFTADAAHELRHPLAVAQMELDLAAAVSDGAARRDHLQRAGDGLARMDRLVRQLLTLARVESLDQLPDAVPLDAAVLAREVVADASERAAPRGISLTLRADPGVTVQASPGLLAVALRNLIDNAITHGRPHGQVGVTVTRRNAAAAIAVDDDGPGLPNARAERAGERFRSGEGSPGSGLGLSIVKAIAALHGGAVTIGRSARGGASVVLQLPAVAPGAA